MPGGVRDTGRVLFPGVRDTGGVLFPGVSDTGRVLFCGVSDTGRVLFCGGLKGQWHKIFEVVFFHQTASYGPIRGMLRRFFFLQNFVEIFEFFKAPRCLRHR